MSNMDWIDNADSYICPVCRIEVNSPAKSNYQCPRCGFIAERDKNRYKQMRRTSMEIYKYQVDKVFIKEKDGDPMSHMMVGKRVPDMSHGYIFVDDHSEAIRTLESKYPSNEYIRYDIHLDWTNIIEL